jgi:hypothetical protein
MSIFNPFTSSPGRNDRRHGKGLIDPDQGEQSHLIAMISILFFILVMIGLAFLLPDLS